MKNSISVEKGALERDRYAEKQRSSHTIKIICDAAEMNLIYRDQVRGPTQEALCDMGRQEEVYYVWNDHSILEPILMAYRRLPARKDSGVWGMFQGHPMEYLSSLRIRHAAISVGKEPPMNFLIRKRGKTNYDVLDYIRRMQLLGNDKGVVDGIPIEWKEVRISDNCAQPLMKIRSIENTAQQVDEGKVVRRSKFPREGRPSNQDTFERMIYGRLLKNTEI